MDAHRYKHAQTLARRKKKFVLYIVDAHIQTCTDIHTLTLLRFLPLYFE